MRACGSANRPSRRTDWRTVNWRRANRIVRNLRQRIFRATQANDRRRVRSLQKLLLRSYSNILLNVRRVTQLNAGKYTPGVDRLVVKTPAARGCLVDQLTTLQPWRAHPVRRVYIPKKSDSSKQRPLGIPTVLDRCLQARVLNALEPEWEARFEGTSYGFRPGRCCHDAIGRIYLLVPPNGRKRWVVDADIEGAFDNLDHDFLLRALGDVPGRELVKQWLKAGVLEEGVVHETAAGVPQGGVISPLLLNVALHGLEAAVGVTYNRQGYSCGRRAVVRYADDFVVLCKSREDALGVKDRLLPAWLAERGLRLSATKTRIVHLTEGFDFLGFTVRHHASTQAGRPGYKRQIKPSKKAVLALRQELREAWRALKGHNIHAVLDQLNPIIRGWAGYYRRVVASKTFRQLDRWMFRRAKRYARSTHPKKSWRWCINRYWGKWNKAKKDNWVFGDKHNGRYLLKFRWFKIVRHLLVRGRSSPDDARLREYWWARRALDAAHLPASDRKLGVAQGWTCRVCGLPLMNGEELQRHHKNPKVMGGSEAYSNRELVHLYCHQQETYRQSRERNRSSSAEEQL
jgi:RNA-directed DNA polymerase